MADPGESRVYCASPQHKPGDHDITCMPPAEPRNPELRLLRAIYGLCPDHDACTPDMHTDEEATSDGAPR